VSNPTLKFAAIVALGLAASSCASRGTYSEFAQAGETYAGALDRLLLASGNLAVDSNSWQIINSDGIRNYDARRYEAQSAPVEARLKIIGRLRAHARLLGAYFGRLRALAASDAPERVGEGLAGIATALNGLGTTLRAEAASGAEPLVRNPEIFQEVGRLAVSFFVRGALRSELEQRQELIRKELRTQEILLARLAKIIEDEDQIVREGRLKRLVIDPLTKPGPVEKPDQWVEVRRTILTSGPVLAAELSDASKAATKLREAFEALVQGKLSAADIVSLAKDLEALIAVVKTLEKQP
jgi:hypothetical protein